jgi:hypothetical protein
MDCLSAPYGHCAQFFEGSNSMITLFKLEEHLMMLLVEDKLCFEEGDWDRLESIRLAIDDTRDQIDKLQKGVNK